MNFKQLVACRGRALGGRSGDGRVRPVGGGGCQAEALQDPPRTVLTCPNGVRIVAEAGTTFELQDRSSAAGPEAVTLDGKALLLEAPAGAVEGGFEVITPQAIAAVRGTKWAVDVAEGKTSVFVVTGRVAVSREAGCAQRRARAGRRRRRGGGNGAAGGPQVGSRPCRGAACPLRRIGLHGPPAAADARAVLLAGLWGAWPRLSASRGEPWFLDRVEATMADLRTLVRGVRKPPPVVLIVAIDDETVRQEGKYPLSRGTLARIIDAVAQFSPKAVALDILLLDAGDEADDMRVDRRAGPQPQRDRRRSGVRRSQADGRRRWRRSAGARADRR